jgi:flagella basal body P-ring formation protein FlgA
MRAALIEAINAPDAQVELLEFSSQPLPTGRLEFQRSTLSLPPPGAPETPVIWRGRLLYDGRHSAVVWAKVRIQVERTVCVAAEDIPAGAIIHDRQVKAIKTRQSPFAGIFIDSPVEIIGKIARRGLREGQNFLPAMLEEPKDVAKGDVIQVRVIDGLATLSLDGIAQSSGNKGDTILVHNSASGRNFRAVVEEKGKAVVHYGSGD